MSIIWQLGAKGKNGIKEIVATINKIIDMNVSRVILYGDISRKEELIFIVSRLTRHNISVVLIAECVYMTEEKLEKLSANKKVSMYVFIDPNKISEESYGDINRVLDYLKNYTVYDGIISPAYNGYYVSKNTSDILEHIKGGSEKEKFKCDDMIWNIP